MEKKLLILGLLLSHGMHGYQLNEMLEHNPGTPISLKKSNAYKLLDDMEKDGWVTHTLEKEGNRPQRPQRRYGLDLLQTVVLYEAKEKQRQVL